MDDDNGFTAYSIKRVYRTHTTDGTLKKLTAYIYGEEYTHNSTNARQYAYFIEVIRLIEHYF